MRTLALYPLLCGLAVQSASAALVAHTDPIEFQNALRGTAITQDFDALVAGVISGTALPLSSAGGSPLATVTMPSSIPDPFGGASFDAAVVANDGADSNPTRSLPNSLGSTDAGNYNTLVAGTSVGFSFSSFLSGFGAWVVTPDDLLDGDVSLHAGGAVTSLAVADRAALGSFGGIDYFGYFLGMTSTGVIDDFLEVEFRSPVEVTGAFLYNLDDLIGGMPTDSRKIADGIGSGYDRAVQEQYLGASLTVDFTSLTPGEQPGPVEISGNGFDIVVSAEDTGGGSTPLVVPAGGGVTTAAAGARIGSTVDGAPVHSIGGLVEVRDAAGNPVAGELDFITYVALGGGEQEYVRRVVYDPATGLQGSGSNFISLAMEPGVAFGGAAFQILGYALVPLDPTQYVWADQGTYGAFADPDAVPAPGVLLLLIPGLAVLAGLPARRKRRQRLAA